MSNIWKKTFYNKQRTEQYDTPDPDTVQWDPETGLPIGLQGPPKGNDVQRYQWKAKEMAAQHNARSRRAAMAYLDQGARISESFRPGGYAGTVGSGLYQARSALAASDEIEEPDLQAGWRADEAARARKAAKRAGYTALAGQVIGGVAGFMVGGPVGAAAGSQLGGAVGNAAASGDRARAASAGANAQGGAPSGGAYPLQQQGQEGGGRNVPVGPGGGQGGSLPAGNQGSPMRTQDDPEQAGGGQDSPQAGAGGGSPMANPYALAETLHFEFSQDGFYDGMDLMLKQALAERMSDYAETA